MSRRLLSPGSVALSVSVLALFLSCGKDESPQQEPPRLPPVSTMVMDFSDFQQGGVASSPLVPDSRANWGWAAIQVGIWNTILTVTLAVPVASFVEAFNHEPTPESDGSWRWSYEFAVGGASYLAELYGRLMAEGTRWDMYITKAGVYERFHWYQGLSSLDLSSGTWTLFRAPESPSPFLGIVWRRSPNTGDLTYTNIVPAHPDSGGFIRWGLTGGLPYDASYSIFSPSDANTTDIEWNRTTHEGRVRDPLHFGDTNWHCWNSDLEDVVCP